MNSKYLTECLEFTSYRQLKIKDFNSMQELLINKNY